jgi:hypothetical protein
LLKLFFDHEDGRDIFLGNIGWLVELHGVIFLKIKLFVTTAVRT